VLNFGRRIADGESMAVLRHPDVVSGLPRDRIMPLLQINDLIVLYGEIEALRGVSISVDEGQVVTLLGANGAGKSTTLRAISGLAKPAAGEILFDGNRSPASDLKPLSGSASPCAGGAAVFPGLTVKENIMLALEPAHREIGACRAKPTPCSICFRTSGHFPMRSAGPCPAGNCRWSRGARLMAKPRLLLLDEPRSASRR